MQPHQRRFLELAVRCEALRFGEFTLKSGRQSPYFFNAGRFDSGAALATLADCYADALAADGLAFDMLFGPAYKGIPLASALAMALAQRGRDVALAFNRKEAKTHGEGGSLIGAPLQGRVLIVDDVITAGTAVRESVELIRATGAQAVGVVVALDRQERGEGARSACTEIAHGLGIRVVAVASLNELLAYTGEQPELASQQPRLSAYRDRFGASGTTGDSP
jgi:orotate phosphoribosyltransferase